MKPRILLDCDGVVADFVGTSFRLLSERGGGSYDPSKLLTWDLELFVDPVDHDRLKSMWNEPGFCLSIDPLPGTDVLHKKMMDDVAEIYFVTAPMASCPTWSYERGMWISRYLPLSEGVIHTDNKFLVSGDVFVDDKVSHVRAWQKYHPNGIGVVWACSHNASANDLPRVSSWDSVFEIAETAAWNKDKSWF